MKKTINKYLVLLGLLGSFTSCQLAEELDDYKPLYALDAETAITSQETAELALTGAYAAFRQKSSGGAFPEMFLIPEILSGYSTVGPSYASRPEQAGWIQNNPIATGAATTWNVYTGLYDLINRTNWLISAVEKLDDSNFEAGRREEIIAEAKILRGLGHFYLLRNFGQFYDVSSQYGVNLRLEPVRSAEAFPRNSVSETYEAIIADLDEGISDAPDLRSKRYTNKTFAKALKARVLLYMGDYSEAAALAKDIIDNLGSSFMLEPTYADIFDQHDSPAIFQSSEILFGTSGEPGSNIGIGNFYSGFFITVTPKYLEEISGSIEVDGELIPIDAGQRSGLFHQNFSYGGFYSTKYTSFFTSGDYEMIYHMRMAEVYLIFAEADARANNAVTPEALEALNTIRERAGAQVYPETIGLEQFLTAVRLEKLAELHAEGGEPWYDLIRYDYIDGFGSGFQVSDVKPTATNPDKFILPIPQESIDVSGGMVIQNPSY